LISTYDNKGTCGYFYLNSNGQNPINPISRRLFGRPVDMVFPVKDGKVVVGDPLETNSKLVTSPLVSPQSFHDKSSPIAGPAGLEDAVQKGLLRNATMADAEAWSDALATNSPNPDVPPIAGIGTPKPTRPGLHRAFVVLQLFTYPSGLYGGNSATFFIPRGVPAPDGNPGHSAVYDFNTLKCNGALCGH
jgi:hypothetical protein